MNRIIISEENDPYYNLALEEELLENLKGNEKILYLWINSSCVIIGRNQNPYLECNLNFLKEKNIELLRRKSGGGAVYQDLGNLNYTFINNTDLEISQKYQEILIESLKEKHIDSFFSGRNDILIKDKKISGQAFYEINNKMCLHGTLLVNVDLDNLVNSLKPSYSKLISKGISSIKSRVGNLKDFNKSINIKELKEILITKYKKKISEDVNIEYYNKKNFFPKYYREYKKEEWNLENCPEFIFEKEIIYEEGILKISFKISNGIIKDIIFSSDSLKRLNLIFLREKLINKKFSENEIKIFLDDLRSE